MAGNLLRKLPFIRHLRCTTIITSADSKGILKMRCEKCDTEMFTANLTGNNLYPVFIKNKKKGLLESEKWGEVMCYVCPECGKVKLYAKDPKKLML